MTRAEVARLLGLAAARDRRTVGVADVAAWLVDVGDLDFGDAKLALERHFRESTDWLMPAHIHRHVKTIRAERREAEHHEVLALPSRFEDDPDREARLAAGVARCSEILAPLMTELARRRTDALTPGDQLLARARDRARRERKGRRS